MIDLSALFGDLGIVGHQTIEEGSPSYTQYNFFNGIIWDDDVVTYNQYDFFQKVGGRWNFFKNYESEKAFYAAVDDERIYNFRTFYEWAGEYLVASGIAESLVFYSDGKYSSITGANIWRPNPSIGIIVGCAVSNDNHVYFGTNDGKFSKFTTDGVLVWTITLGATVIATMAVDYENNIVLVFSSSLRKYDSDGVLLWTYSQSVGVASTINSRIVVDTENNIIYAGSRTVSVYLWKINKNGVLLWTKTTSDSSLRQTCCVDPNNNVYGHVTNSASVGKWDPNGVLLLTYTSPIVGVLFLYDITVDNEFIYIATSKNEDLVLKFDLDFNLIFQSPQLSFADRQTIQVDGAGNFYLQSGGALWKWDTNNNIILNNISLGGTRYNIQLDQQYRSPLMG